MFEAGWGGQASPPQTSALSLLRLRIVLRVSKVREAVTEWHVVGIDTVAELVVRRLVEAGGQRRASCQSLKLDVDYVIGRPASVREARVVTPQNPKPFQRFLSFSGMTSSFTSGISRRESCTQGPEEELGLLFCEPGCPIGRRTLLDWWSAGFRTPNLFPLPWGRLS